MSYEEYMMRFKEILIKTTVQVFLGILGLFGVFITAKLEILDLNTIITALRFTLIAFLAFFVAIYIWWYHEITGLRKIKHQS